MSAKKELILKRPDDCHLHLRDGLFLERTVKDAAQHFGRVVVMPNLVPPIVTVEQALLYRDRILQKIPSDKALEPWMTLYLTEETEAQSIHQASETPFMAGVKWYPKGATTHSEKGVSSKPSSVILPLLFPNPL